MARNNAIQQQEVAAFRQSLIDEVLIRSYTMGHLDDMLITLENLEKNGNRNFLEEIFGTYFRDSIKYMETIEQLLDKESVDAVEVFRIVRNLYRSSMFIGAQRVSNEASQLRDHGIHQNWDGCKASLELVRREHAVMRVKMETYFRMKRLAGPAETADRPCGADNE